MGCKVRIASEQQNDDSTAPDIPPTNTTSTTTSTSIESQDDDGANENPDSGDGEDADDDDDLPKFDFIVPDPPDLQTDLEGDPETCLIPMLT